MIKGSKLTYRLPKVCGSCEGDFLAKQASATHKNNKLPYVKNYLKTIGARKCEANAIVTTPDKARRLVRDEIESWLGIDARSRFKEKRAQVKEDYIEELRITGLKNPIETVLNED